MGAVADNAQQAPPHTAWPSDRSKHAAIHAPLQQSLVIVPLYSMTHPPRHLVYGMALLVRRKPRHQAAAPRVALKG